MQFSPLPMNSESLMVIFFTVWIAPLTGALLFMNLVFVMFVVFAILLLRIAPAYSPAVFCVKVESLMSNVPKLSIAPAPTPAELFVIWTFSMITVPQLSIAPLNSFAMLFSSVEFLSISKSSLLIAPPYCAVLFANFEFSMVIFS